MSLTAKLGADAPEKTRGPVLWKDIPVKTLSHKKWGKQRDYSDQQIRRAMDHYEQLIIRGEYHEARCEESEEGYPKDWLDQVIWYAIQEKEQDRPGKPAEPEIAAKIRDFYHYRGF